MTKQQKALLLVTAFILPFVLLYLFGAFVRLEMDVTQWTEEGRFRLVYFGTLLSIQALIVAFAVISGVFK